MRRLAVVLLLAGCTVGPDWQQPKVETPPAWRIDYAQARWRHERLARGL